MSTLKPLGEDIKGPIGWMTNNRVTPNLMMIVLILGGLWFASNIKQEVIPEFDLDMVKVMVPYPGSSPEEVEQGIILAIEEGVRGLDGVKEITATASEGAGTVMIELLEGTDNQRVYQDIKQEVDRITTFPEDAEEPEVSMMIHKREVLQLQLYGDVSEWVLRELAEQVRDSLLQNRDISQIELRGARSYEVQVLVDQHTLQRYGLTLQEVATKIRATSVELPGGYVETPGGDLLLRVKDRRDWAREFAKIPIITTADGSVLRLEEIAQVRDDFEQADKAAFFDSKRAIGIAVFRIGDQTPVGVSKAVHKAMDNIESQLPEGIGWTVSNDMSDIYSQRLHLLLKNAGVGLILVLILLGCFLEFKLAFWVTMGIPTAFLGAFLFLPQLGSTINMISMFAFIIALGIVVDDAIVVGENVYEYRNRGMDYVTAAIRGARDVSLPVTFSILTNMVAFLPLCFVSGVMGKFFRTIPIVVITVFAISWVESLIILPSHLGHAHQRSRNRLSNFLHERQQVFSRWFMRFIEHRFAPFLDFCIKYRQITVAMGIAILIGVLGFVKSGRIGVLPMPRVESDLAVATATLPVGSPMSRAQEVADLVEATAQAVIDENGGDQLCDGIFQVINENKVEVYVYLQPPEVRPISTSEFKVQWRNRTGQVTGTEMVQFDANRFGPGRGPNLTVELSHRDIAVLDKASEALAGKMADFPTVKDIDDGYIPGKQQLDFKIKPAGQSLGLTSLEVGRQVRNAFYGAEALRQQRGRNEVRVRVKLPDYQRSSEYNVEQLLIRTPAGTDVPLMEVAEVVRGRSYTTIQRRNARRTVTVTANVEPASETSKIQESLKKEILPKLTQEYPGLSYGWEGQQADFGESLGTLRNGFVVAMLCIYAMLAIPFRSYAQPLIVMVAIPFGIVGAVLGHIIMGYSLSIMTMMGVVALSGVVVNDSLVLIDYANRLRKNNGVSAFEAIHQAGVRRFRPIMLTTLTTFGGLAPMIFETSMQARFLIPMAISLGYGILFATTITLVLVPCLYMLLDDGLRFFKRFTQYIGD
ncbi:MAG: efflux RND transporter permease subunit [Planctomycetota bacterium]|jgi:multidrug efflux pump subunit AcrB